MYHLMSGHLNGMSLHWKEALVLDTFLSGLFLYLCLLRIYVCMMNVCVCVEARGWFLFIYLTILLFIDWDIIFHLHSWIINLNILVIWVWYEILVLFLPTPSSMWIWRRSSTPYQHLCEWWVSKLRLLHRKHFIRSAISQTSLGILHNLCFYMYSLPTLVLKVIFHRPLLIHIWKRVNIYNIKKQGNWLSRKI